MLKVNKTILKVVNRARQHCLWDKKTITIMFSLAPWGLVCTPKGNGGLVVINTEIQHDFLVIKNLFKLFSHNDTPWVDMVWQAYYKHSLPQATGPVGSFWW
jgi:hypothetical protein